MFTNWFHELALFLVNVLSHWQALATGGLVTAGVSVYERKKNATLSWQSYAFIIAAFLLYSVFAAWQDEHHNTDKVISEKAAYASQYNGCAANLTSTQSSLRDKDSLAASLQGAIISMQAPQEQQQANITSCINNLAKMNPIIREKISVIPVVFGTQSATGRVNDPKGLVIAYLSELFIITNEPERNFNGDLKCNKDFTIVDPPRINPRDTVTMIMVGGTTPKPIAPNEYLITVDSTGTEWNPSHPAFLGIRTKDKDVGCTFTPQE